MTRAERKNPFPGPRHYDAKSVVHCVQRNTLTEVLLENIYEESFIVLFGPSGAGKSSILCGTIQPRLDGHKFLYNQWRPGASLEQLQDAVLSALKVQVKGIDESILKWFLCLNSAIPSTAHDVVLIFDQLDHLFSPAFAEADQSMILDWLGEIVTPRSKDYRGNVKVLFGVRDDYLGQLISALADSNQFSNSFFQIPRLRQSEILATAVLAVPEWASPANRSVIEEQLRATYIHKDTKHPDPEINAPLAQILLYERYEDERLCHPGVSFATVMRQYFVSKTKTLIGAVGSGQAVSFFKMLAQKFVDGKKKRICSEADLNSEGSSFGSAWKSALENLISANLITAFGAGADRTYALSHDSLCEIIESEHQQAVALSGANAASEAARDEERKTAAIYAAGTESAIASMKEMSTASVHHAEQQGEQRVRELKEGHQREVNNLSRLHLAAVEREQAARRLAQQELLQAHQREQNQLKQFHSSQLAQLRQQHVSEVEGVTRTLGQQVAETQAESERRALEQQRTQEQLSQEKTARADVEVQLSQEKTARANVAEQLSQAQTARLDVEARLSQEHTARAEVEEQLSQAKTTRANVAAQLSQEQTARANVEEQLSQEQTARANVEEQLSQEQTARLDVEEQLSQEQTARLDVEEQLSQEQTARLDVEAMLSQEQTAHAAANAQLAQTCDRLADREKELGAAKQTSETRRKRLRWGGGIAVVALTMASGTGGYGWMRAQALQTTVRIEQVGRKEDGAKCKEEEAIGRQQRQAERRIGLAECLLQKVCEKGGGSASLKRNPNSAASLLVEIPAGLRSGLPLWSATARQSLRSGRVRVADISADEGRLSGLEYRDSGEVLVFLDGKAGGRQVMEFRDEGAVPGKVRSLPPGLRVLASAGSPLWHGPWEGRLRAWPSAAAAYREAVRSRHYAPDCMNRTLQVAPRFHPFAVIPFVGPGDSRVLILTGEGILLRDAACPARSASRGIPETWLNEERRLGPYPYQHAIVDDQGTFVVAATGTYLRAAAVPNPSAPAPDTDDPVMTLDVTDSGSLDVRSREQSRLVDVQFRQGSSGRVAVASGQRVSFWDLGAAQRKDERDLPRFATDCIEPKHRQGWLDESPQEAEAAYAQCLQRTGRRR